MLKDRPKLHRQLRTLKNSSQLMDTIQLRRLEIGIETSRACAEQRRRELPQPKFATELPIVAKIAEIKQALDSNQIVVVCGETGSGKTTQLPKICLELKRGVFGMIGHTQPRRIAARSVATRVADELGTSLGEVVGYQVRFNAKVRDTTHIKLMTDGILLAEIKHDRQLLQYDTLIIDEAHERSLNIDFLLGYLKMLLPDHPDLKIVITSATIDPQRFAAHFGGVPIIEVSGRGYPVEIRYRPLLTEAGKEREPQTAILEATDELNQLDNGDILVFLPGERAIRDTAEALRKHHPPGTEILPLYARLSTLEQNRVFQPHLQRRIVLATNVAETSLTVPGIKFVIDTGTARISRYSIRSKVQRLPVEAISQASARQRAGRCGRTSPGTCIRLYSEDDLNNRPLFTDPEIRRTNLASVILQMIHLKLGAVETFPFIGPPDQRQINDGYKLLEELGAVDAERRLTQIGYQIARLPVDPRLARIIVAAERQHCLQEILIIVSALSIQDPRERPLDRREAADEKHRPFLDERSDFLALIKLWEYLRERKKHLSKIKFRRLCTQNFLSFSRVYEWQDIHGQLRTLTSGVGMRLNQESAEYAPIHRALLAGLLSHIGFKDEDNEFKGARNRSFWIFPGSGLSAKPPKWVVVAELVETSRLYARTVAKIEPQWVVAAAPHLIKTEYFEPHWQPHSGRVAAFERTSLFGLVLIPRRRINFGTIDASQARAIFIREALVAGRFRTQAKFFHHNRHLIAEIKALEAKTRRRDILVSEEEVYRFYDERVPLQVYDSRSFEQWLKGNGQESQLRLSKSLLVGDSTVDVSDDRYPQRLVTRSETFPLTYHFEPGDDKDGVTLTVPLPLLNQVDPALCEWLVPGLLQEKIIALIKGLPKQLRRNFVPVPKFAQACTEAMKPYQGTFRDALSQELLRMTGFRVTPEVWRFESLPDHLRMRFRVVDAGGKTIQTGRDLTRLQSTLAGQFRRSFSQMTPTIDQGERLTQWKYDHLAQAVVIEQSGINVRAYRALIDHGEYITLKLVDTPEHAHRENIKGVRRLYLLALPSEVKYLQKHLLGTQALCLLYQRIDTCEALKSDIVEAAFNYVFLDGMALPENRLEFDKRLAAGKPCLISTANEICRLTGTILKVYHTILKHLRKNSLVSRSEAIDDIKEQLTQLVYRGFVRDTPAPWLKHLPRFLKAIEIRLQKLEHAPEKDRKLCEIIRPFWEIWTQSTREDNRTVKNEEAFVNYRWMLEELRVSLFAQTLGTSVSVSAKRLQRQWDKVIGKHS
jgi:ATP-dependent RNA helicase HrpA